MAKAKKGEVYREDLMIYAVPKHPGVRYYLIERASYEQSGAKHCVNRFGTQVPASFDDDLAAAEAALQAYPARPADDDEPQGAVGDAVGDEQAQAAAETTA